MDRTSAFIYNINQRLTGFLQKAESVCDSRQGRRSRSAL